MSNTDIVKILIELDKNIYYNNECLDVLNNNINKYRGDTN